LEFCGEEPSDCFNGRCLFFHGGIGTAPFDGRVNVGVMVESIFHEYDNELAPGGGCSPGHASMCYQIFREGWSKIRLVCPGGEERGLK
jgi:hypothetical protein